MRRSAIAVLALSALAACRTVPDPDAQPEDAQPLPLSAARDDSLECRRGDCADWFRIEVSAAGDLEIDVESIALPAVGERPVRAELIDESGEVLGGWTSRPGSEGAAALRVRRKAQRGSYWVGIYPADLRSRIGYRVLAQFQPTPLRQASKRFETQRSAVLEVEGSGTRVRAVLLEAGAAQRLAPGQRGRLVESGQTIGEIEIVEVFAEGSRARIAGELRDPIGPGTTAEIQVPVRVPASRAPADRD